MSGKVHAFALAAVRRIVCCSVCRLFLQSTGSFIFIFSYPPYIKAITEMVCFMPLMSIRMEIRKSCFLPVIEVGRSLAAAR